MFYSAENSSVWNVIIQFGYIAAVVLIANLARRRISFVRKSMMPVAVLAGFILLLAKYIGIAKINHDFMEILTYHGIALGFIAMSLRVPDPNADGKKGAGFKSGAVIVSTYMVQGVTGLIITILLGFTFMPKMFKAAGLLLPMGYGQGPGQANNVGATYQALGFDGGHSFGLAIAAMGYIVACVVGVVMLNILRRQGKIKTLDVSVEEESYTADYFHSKGEMPISESIDKLSVQLAMIVLVYVATFMVSKGITGGIGSISAGLAGTVNPLIWGFNFIIGSALALLLRVVLEKLRGSGIITRQYQNNYLLNRLSGLFFDMMIVAGIACIDVEDIRGLIVPFILLTVIGGIVTWIHLTKVCKVVYKDYYYEGLISMFGMLTGTISSGVILLREIDPGMKTPAANNLVTGSSFGILLGAPVLVLVGLAPKSDIMCIVTLILAAAYLAALLYLIYKVGKGTKRRPEGEQ